jgi:hypothetical protein
MSSGKERQKQARRIFQSERDANAHRGRLKDSWCMVAGDDCILPNEPNLTVPYLMEYATLGIHGGFMKHQVKMLMKVQFDKYIWSCCLLFLFPCWARIGWKSIDWLVVGCCIAFSGCKIYELWSYLCTTDRNSDHISVQLIGRAKLVIKIICSV